METVKGTLELVNIPSCPTLEETCKVICRCNGYDLENPKYDFYGSWEELLNEHLYENYIIIAGKLFKIESEQLDSNGFAAVTKNGNKLKFVAHWYNGGGSLNEVLESAINKVEK